MLSGQQERVFWDQLKPWFPAKARKLFFSRSWTVPDGPREVWHVLTPPLSATSCNLKIKRAQPLRLLSIVYWCSKISGVLPLSFDKVTETLNYSTRGFVFSALTLLCVFTLWCYMTKELHETFVQEGNVLSGVEPIVLTLLNFLLMLVAFFRCGSLKRVVHLLFDLEIALAPPKGPGPLAFEFACVVPAILTILAVIADLNTSLIDSTLFDTFLYAPYYWTALGAMLVEMQFLAACATLRFFFWLLNQKLLGVRRRAVGAALRLEGFRLAHGRLCNAAAVLEDVFGPQLLLDCGLCFLGTVLNAYFALNGFYDGGNGTDASVSMQETQWLWALLYLGRVASLCLATTRLVQEVKSTHAGRLLHSLGDTRLAPEMKEEIRLFSMQLSTAKIEFTAWGIFTIDFSLLFGIVSSTTTYLLILIQYRPR